MNSRRLISTFLVISFIVFGLFSKGCSQSGLQTPKEIDAIFDKPLYRNAIWGLRVVDLDTGEVLYDLNPDYPFLIGSVRKLFSVGVLLNQVGAGHTFTTPVYRQGTIAGGVLTGDLILVASGDLTMGGRTNPDGTIAISDFDHNEADSLGNAVLTAPNPLAGFLSLAQQVAASGITQITGDVVIDDRLFQPFNFRGEFDVSPLFVNDDVIDVIINPTSPGLPASVDWRPQSSAFSVVSTLTTTSAGTQKDVDLDPELPSCIGSAGCTGNVLGDLPVDFLPPFTNQFPLIQTFRIVSPANYARTVFMEALQNSGVALSTNVVGPNPAALLPPPNSYAPGAQVARLISLPYSDYAKLILKVSYNIGADTSLVLFGLTQGVNNMNDSLVVERAALATNYGINPNAFSFVDGSGGGLTTATNQTVTTLLQKMSQTSVFPPYLNALPILAVDGSLGFVTDFEQDHSLAGAKGNVFAKTGTFIEGTAMGPDFRAQALGGYITAKSGRRLGFELVVNEVGVIAGLDSVLQTFQDQGTIAAILWRDH